MELSNAKQQFSFSRQNFLKITGSNNIRPNTLIQTPQPDTLLIDGKFEDLIDRALNNNFEIRAGEKAVEIARLEVLKNIADHSPTVDFIAQYVQSNSASDFTIGNQYKTTQAGVVITVPLYSGGRVTAVTRQADANHRKALADLQSTKNRINANFHKAYEGLNTARERWDMAVASMKANMTDLDSMKKQQNSGLKSKVDVVMAERNLAESQRDETLAKVEWILAKASLMGLMGDIEKIVGQEYTSLFSNQF
jgi:protease secretion system outer membrane protein